MKPTRELRRSPQHPDGDQQPGHREKPDADEHGDQRPAEPYVPAPHVDAAGCPGIHRPAAGHELPRRIERALAIRCAIDVVEILRRGAAAWGL